MDEEAIGINAGKVWNHLHEAHSLTKHQLLMRTQLPEHQLDAAIGWLARENKIKKEGMFFCLDDTNLTETVGTKAGKLFEVMQQLPENVSVLKNLTDFTQEELHQAIGWLAKEGNIVPSHTHVSPDLVDAKETIHLLHHQIQSLHHDISKRNHIIQDLTQQLTQKQIDFMKRADVIEQLNDQLSLNQKSPLSDESIKDAQKNIVLLTEEIETLHHEISSRNQIIQDLSHQLTEKQTMFIQQTEVLDRLQQSLCKEPTSSSNSVTTAVQQRIQDVSFLQKCLEQKQDEHLTPQMRNSTLISKNTPTIQIDPQQHQAVNDELNHVLHHHRQPESLFESSTQKTTIHDKKIDRQNHHRC